MKHWAYISRFYQSTVTGHQTCQSSNSAILLIKLNHYYVHHYKCRVEDTNLDGGTGKKEVFPIWLNHFFPFRKIFSTQK